MTTGHLRTFKDYYRGVSSWQSPWDDPNLMDVRPFIVTTTDAFVLAESFDGELLSLIIIIKSICLFCATPCYTLIVDDFDLLFNGQHRVYRHSLAHCLWTNTRVALQIDCLIVPYCSMFLHIYPQLYSFIYIHPIFQLHLPSSASKFLFRLNTCARRCNLGGQNCWHDQNNCCAPRQTPFVCNVTLTFQEVL